MNGLDYNGMMNKIYLGDKAMNKPTLKNYSYEYTDTYAGERNYCWCQKGYVKARNKKHAMRLARAELGMTGFKGDYSELTGFAEWRPHGCCTILTVEWSEVES